MPITPVMAYLVQLDWFHGPLDLLLYLVRKDEVDILEISLSRLADQFLDYLRTAREIDVEFAGEFLVLAATLLEIKSQALLPVEESPDGGAAPIADPRRELVKQLLEYRKYKDAAGRLEALAEARASHYSRTPAETAALPGTPVVRSVEIWDLIGAFARILRETQTDAGRTVVADDTPQRIYEERILQKLADLGSLEFADLFDRPFARMRLIGIFLALLELIKSGRVMLIQNELFGAIRIASTGPKLAEAN